MATYDNNGTLQDPPFGAVPLFKPGLRAPTPQFIPNPNAPPDGAVPLFQPGLHNPTPQPMPDVAYPSVGAASLGGRHPFLRARMMRAAARRGLGQFADPKLGQLNDPKSPVLTAPTSPTLPGGRQLAGPYTGTTAPDGSPLTVDQFGIQRYGSAVPDSQRDGTWLDDYRMRQGDGFTGTRDGQNFINGHLYAAQGNASGGDEFANLLKAYGPQLTAMGAAPQNMGGGGQLSIPGGPPQAQVPPHDITKPLPVGSAPGMGGGNPDNFTSNPNATMGTSTGAGGIGTGVLPGSGGIADNFTANPNGTMGTSTGAGGVGSGNSLARGAGPNIRGQVPGAGTPAGAGGGVADNFGTNGGGTMGSSEGAGGMASGNATASPALSFGPGAMGDGNTNPLSRAPGAPAIGGRSMNTIAPIQRRPQPGIAQYANGGRVRVRGLTTRDMSALEKTPPHPIELPPGHKSEIPKTPPVLVSPIRLKNGGAARRMGLGKSVGVADKAAPVKGYADGGAVEEDFRPSYQDYQRFSQASGGSEATGNGMAEKQWNALTPQQQFQLVGGGLALMPGDPRYQHFADLTHPQPGRPIILYGPENNQHEITERTVDPHRVYHGGGVTVTPWDNHTPRAQYNHDDAFTHFLMASGLLLGAGMGANALFGLNGAGAAGAGVEAGTGAFDVGGSSGFGGSTALSGGEEGALGTGAFDMNGSEGVFDRFGNPLTGPEQVPFEGNYPGNQPITAEQLNTNPTIQQAARSAGQSVTQWLQNPQNLLSATRLVAGLAAAAGGGHGGGSTPLITTGGGATTTTTGGGSTGPAWTPRNPSGGGAAAGAAGSNSPAWTGQSGSMNGTTFTSTPAYTSGEQKPPDFFTGTDPLSYLNGVSAHYSPNAAVGSLVSEAATAGSPQEQEAAAARANADVTQSFAKSAEAQRRRMIAQGENPDDGRGTGFELSRLNALDEAKAAAGAQNVARLAEKEKGFSRRAAAAGLSLNDAGQSLNADQINAGIAGTRAGLAGNLQTARANIGSRLYESDQDRGFRSGESAADRAFRGGEMETDRRFRSGESAADRNFRSGESSADRTFRGGESELDRQFRSGEAAAGRTFTGGQNDADRNVRVQQINAGITTQNNALDRQRTRDIGSGIGAAVNVASNIPWDRVGSTIGGWFADGGRVNPRMHGLNCADGGEVSDPQAPNDSNPNPEDTIPAMLTDNEHVVNPEGVELMDKLAPGFLDQINKRGLRIRSIRQRGMGAPA
jgi:hypothetical protein